MDNLDSSSKFTFKYISADELQRILKSVQQKRQDSLADLKWQDRLQRLQGSHVREVEDRTEDNMNNQTESSESVSCSEDGNTTISSSSSSTRSVETDCKVIEQLCQPQRSKKSNQTKVLRKSIDHRQTIVNIKKSQNALRDIFLAILQRFEIEQFIHEDESEDAELRRKVRLSEFSARLRRNYLCTLKLETKRVNAIVRKTAEGVTKSFAAKQAAFRTLSRALAVSRSALKVFQIQTVLWADFLLKLDLLQEILELLAGLDEALAVMNILDDEYVHSRKNLLHSLSKALIDAELDRVQRERAKTQSKKVVKQVVRQGPKKKTDLVKKQRGEKHILTSAKKLNLPANPRKPVSQTPLEDGSNRGTERSRGDPVNAKLLVMKHDSVADIPNTNIQTAPSYNAKIEVETQTDAKDKPLEESSSSGCDIYRLAQEVLNQISGNNSEDRMAAIIEQIICQELV